MTTINKKPITIFTLVMLITVAIDNIRNLPSTALFGGQLIFFVIFSALVFLIPAALVSAELSAKFPEQGGIYAWVKLAFGSRFGFLAIWFQWINTMVWYPSILSFIAGTFAYLFYPALAQSKLYLVGMILVVFWGLTFLSLKGLHLSARFAGFCAVIGMVIPMAIIITLCGIWLLLGHPSNIQFNVQSLLPHDLHTGSWISLTAIMTSFLGIELATVHVNEIHNPQKTFPRALFYSVILIVATVILGSLAIAIVLPNNQINLVEGVMQAFENFFSAYHLHFLLPLLVIMIILGSLGNMINWIVSPAKGFLQAAEHGYLPAYWTHKNKHQAPGRLLIAQAVLVSLVCLAFLLMPSVNGFYWLLTDLSTEIYMLMYGMMFIAAFWIKHKYQDKPSPFVIPGKTTGNYICCGLGLIGTIVTLIVGFFPPDGINVGGPWNYFLTFSGGVIAMTVPVVFFYAYRAFKKDPSTL
jgi:amino acid transporter